MLPQINFQTFISAFPMLSLLGLAAFALLIEVSLKESGRILNGFVCAVGVFVTALWTLRVGLPMSATNPLFAGSFVMDGYATLFGFVFLVAAFFGLLFTTAQEDVRCGEVYALVLLSTLGMFLMGSGKDLLTILLGLEVMSLSAYALVGVKRTDMTSNEAALKYFLLGAFASAIFLYGMMLVYAATGSIYLEAIRTHLAQGKPLLVVAGLALLIAGFAFKVALVPFHMWTPDVYEGAPTSVTAFMATGIKAAGFAGFLRVLVEAFPSLYVEWSFVLTILAILTMTLGNLVALSQKSLKRMLAYSSIAHAGYILIGVAAARPDMQADAIKGVIFYLASYAFSTAGAFGVICYLDESTDGDDRKRFSGLGWRNPFMAIAMSVFLLSLAGIPPTAGFLGKFYVFTASMKAGLYGLTVVAVLNSLASLYYYLRPMVWMFMEEGEESYYRSLALRPAFFIVALLLCACGTLYLGLLPSNFLEMGQKVAALVVH